VIPFYGIVSTYTVILFHAIVQKVNIPIVTLAETNKNLDEITDLALELQKKTGVKLLWATCNLFAHSRYVDFLYNHWLFTPVQDVRVKTSEYISLFSIYRSNSVTFDYTAILQ
jgi:hypothetical protein